MKEVASLRVAIVGSGPAGFYAAEALQKGVPGVHIDMYDRLPTPFGLVRGGVAPDHPRIKSVTRVFDRIASHPGFRFFGHVHVGRDISIDELRRGYHAVIISIGAETDRALNIPGEDLPGSHAATELVAWYNGHPDFADRRFDFDQPAAAVIGIGNVAMDTVRILATVAESLAPTDLASHALAVLRDSRLAELHIIARRGPVQAACTTPELRELGELDGVDVIVDPKDLELDPESAAHLARDDDRTAANNLTIFRQWAARGTTGAPRQIRFHFNVSPTEILGAGHVEAIRLVRNKLVPDGRGNVQAVPTGESEVLPVGLVFRSVGYRGVQIDGLPFDASAGVIPNMSGRVVEGVGSATALRGVYVTGWIKRGPQGVIGTNKVCAAETVDHLLADAASNRLPDPAIDDPIPELLRQRGVEFVTWHGWQAIDRHELERGKAAGRAREKLVRIGEMLDIVRRGASHETNRE